MPILTMGDYASASPRPRKGFGSLREIPASAPIESDEFEPHLLVYAGFSLIVRAVLARAESSSIGRPSSRARLGSCSRFRLALHHTLRCEVTGEGALALAHAREALEYAERAGSHVARITAYFTLGIANVLNREWRDALEILEQALAIGREQHLRFGEGGVLAVMAAAHLRLGDRDKALALAEEAIAVCRRRGARLWEFFALLTRVRALRELQDSRRHERSRPR